MQAVYSTSTEVKIHQAIRHEWTSFQSQWMFQQLQRLDAREREILHNAQRRWGKMKAPDKEQIAGLQEEFLEDARREWLARVRQRQLHLEHWVMTQDEKHALEQTLGWTYKDMVDAYAKEQAELGPLYQRVDPVSLGSPQPPSMSKFMHPKEPEHRPAYENWGAEIGASTSARSAHPKSPDPKHAYENWAAELARLHGKSPSKQRARSEKSAELPSMPLYFVGALLQGTDLDAVAASHLEEFAVAVSEAKIHEYYEAALKASLRFQRTLPTLDAGQREAFQDEFDVWMRELANKKEREWKAITIQELRKHQAHELQRRAAQQRAMRPRASPPRRRMRQREDYSDDGWNVINSPQTQSSRRTAQRDLFEGYQSPESWSTYLEEYQSPPPPPPPPPARARRPAESEEEYARRPRDGGLFRAMARRNSLRTASRVAATPKATATASRDWSAVHVDELARKPDKVTEKGDRLVVRLDGAKPSVLKKQPKNHSTRRPGGGQNATLGSVARGPRGVSFGGGVSHEEGRVERQVVSQGPAQPHQAEAQHDGVGHRVGGSVGKLGLKSPRVRTKTVRFTPSTISTTDSITSRVKSLAFRELNENHASRFIERFSRAM
ncbi:hypothetical protein FB45DRAFT_957558 [Roridomyces roridus]|uniref:Uncharacterized protein n=1 Tax=Roridomyces roridus TaxID=1738132 RepID=A0AAD7AYD2_9AGAR|nr:hypothetical protein FB45DRAFT_957558 [Roridomyces roridus]